MTLPWYIHSILTSFSFVGLVLFIRWMTSKGFTPKQVLLFMIGFALLGFIGIAGSTLDKVINSDHFFSFLAAGSFAGIFASIGHWADFEAIKRAPNPGYATSIRNCSILPVTILSVFLFGSSLHIFKLVGALLILFGIMALVIERNPHPEEEKKSNPTRRSPWVALSFAALACYTLMVFGMKKAIMLGFAPPEICLCIYVINFLFFSFICRKEVKNYFQDKAKLKFFLPVVIIASIFALAANLLSLKGLELAPNPGYHEALRNTNILFVTLLAIPLFSARFDKLKMLGVIIIVFGIFILVV